MVINLLNNKFGSFSIGEMAEIKFICIFIEFIIYCKDINSLKDMFDEKVILPEQLPVKEK